MTLVEHALALPLDIVITIADAIALPMQFCSMRSPWRCPRSNAHAQAVDEVVFICPLLFVEREMLH